MTPKRHPSDLWSSHFRNQKPCHPWNPCQKLKKFTFLPASRFTIFRKLNAKLRGYYNYFGVIGNYKSLASFYYQAMRRLFKRLNRRSQRKSYTWAGFYELLKYFRIEKPRITEKKLPKQLSMAFWEWGTQANNSEEPGAVIPHAGVCEGAVG